MAVLSSNFLAKAIDKAIAKRPTYPQNPNKRLGSISAYAEGSLKISVILDGEDTASSYPFLDSYYPAIGDRVMLEKVGNTWVVMGSIGGGGISGKPLVRLYAASVQSLANNVVVPLNFATTEIDTHSLHSDTVNNSRVTITKPGYYHFMGAAAFAARSDFFTINVWIRINGSVNLCPAFRAGPSTSQVWVTHSEAMRYMNAGDYAEVVVLQANTATVAINTNVSSQYTSTFEAEFLRP